MKELKRRRCRCSLAYVSRFVAEQETGNLEYVKDIHRAKEIPLGVHCVEEVFTSQMVPSKLPWLRSRKLGGGAFVMSVGPVQERYFLVFTEVRTVTCNIGKSSKSSAIKKIYPSVAPLKASFSRQLSQVWIVVDRSATLAGALGRTPWSQPWW